MMAEFLLAASLSGYCYCACRLTVTLSWLTGITEYNRALVNVICNTCAFPTMSQMSAVKNACSKAKCLIALIFAVFMKKR